MSLLERATSCTYCSRPIDGAAGPKTIKAAHIDHKDPRSRGGPDTIENLQCICARDNRAKGAWTDGEFREVLAALGMILTPGLGIQVIRRLAASKAWR